MSTILVASTPVHGHVTPMLRAAQHLADRGHRVIVLTGSRFGERVRAAGLEFRALTGDADFDDRDPDGYLPDRDRYRGLARAQYDIQSIFVRPIPHQLAAVQAIIAGDEPDVILVDGAFAGVGPIVLGAGPRPAVLALGVTPLAQSSRDVAPFGMAMAPSASPPGRLRNRALTALAHRVLFRQTQRLGVRMFADAGVRLDHPVMDLSSIFDRFLQLGPAGFEYPRSDLAGNTRFIGPLPPAPQHAELPDWWADLDDARPVVHVTQGTIDNHDLGRLLRPTIDALADQDVLVVATTGGSDPDGLGPLPANARLARFVPHADLLPRTSVFVTNGGYGGVLQALRAGVPTVVAGDTEDKPEVAARVAWSGAGIDLRTGRPDPSAIRDAVARILGDTAYADAARALAAEIAALDTLAILEQEVDDAVRRPR